MLIYYVTFAFLSAAFFLAALAVKRVAAKPAVSHQQLRLLPNASLMTPGSNPKSRFDHWVYESLWISGLSFSAQAVLLASLGLAGSVAVLTWAFQLPLAAQILASAALLLVIPIVLLIARRRQLKKFSDTLPASLELIARAVKAGESFEVSIKVAAQAAKDPVQRELKFCSRQLEMGAPVTSVMAHLARRVPTMDVKIFAHTISVHRELGGRLASGVERLAKVIRERQEYVQKINSMTSLGRFAIGAISFMGVFVLAYLLIFHPEYLNKLLDSDLGLTMVIYAVLSELVGLVWVTIALRMEA